MQSSINDCAAHNRNTSHDEERVDYIVIRVKLAPHHISENPGVCGGDTDVGTAGGCPTKISGCHDALEMRTR